MHVIPTFISKIITSKVIKLFTLVCLLYGTNPIIASSGSSSSSSVVEVFENTRFTRVSTNESSSGSKSFRTVFVPGGPGFDSSYLVDLIDKLKLPGSSWRCDLPGNGNYKLEEVFSFEDWQTRFPRAINTFKNSVPGGPLIVVVHSFAGLLALRCPALKDTVDAFIFLNSTPNNTEKEVTEGDFIATSEAAIANKDILNKAAQEETRKYLLPFASGFCPELSLDEAKRFLGQITCSWQPLYWYERNAPLGKGDKARRLSFVPACPTLIVEGTADPLYGQFRKDEGFRSQAGPNITFVELKGAGHFCWLKHGEELKKEVDKFLGISS